MVVVCGLLSLCVVCCLRVCCCVACCSLFDVSCLLFLVLRFVFRVSCFSFDACYLLVVGR